MAAIDPASISKAVIALTAANNMIAANSGQMLVFQPTLITTTAEQPKVPQGAYVMYTSQIMAGEVGQGQSWARFCRVPKPLGFRV